MSEYSEYAEIIKGQIITGKNNKDIEIEQLKERLLDMMDLLQKCYFYLNAVADGKVKTEHLEQIKTLAVLIDNAIGEKK